MSARSRIESPAPKASTDGGQTESKKNEAAEKLLKEAEKLQKEAEKLRKEAALSKYQKDAEDYGSLYCCFCCIVMLLCVGCAAFMFVVEVSFMCHSRTINLALEAYSTISCDGTGIQGAADMKKLIFLSCPLDITSLPRWTPEEFGFLDFKAGFSTNASWAHQEVSMYQCEEEALEHTVGIVDPKTGKELHKKKTYTYKYSLGWRNKPLKSDGFSGLDGRVVSASKESKEALQKACGANFKGNPHFPAGMKTETKAAKAVTLAGGKIDVSRYKEDVEMKNVSLDQKASLPQTFRFLEDDTSLVSCDMSKPTVGCLRVSYKQSTVKSVSLMAMPVKKGNSFDLVPWQPPDIGNHNPCSDTAFSKFDLFAEGIQTVNDIVASVANSAARTQWTERFGLVVSAGIGFCIVWSLMPSVAMGVIWKGDAEMAKFWHNVGTSRFPVPALFGLAAMMLLGIASWISQDGVLSGGYGLGAALWFSSGMIWKLVTCGFQPKEEEKKAK